MSERNPKSEIEPITSILKLQAIPCWERFGTARLAMTARTLKEFQSQSPPELIRTTVKKRTGTKVTSRNWRIFNNTSSFLESWPEDDLATFRYPTLVYVTEGEADFRLGDYIIHCPQNHFLLFATDVPRPQGNHSHFEVGDFSERKCSVLWFFAPPGTNSVTAYVCHSQGDRHWDDGYRIVHRPEVVHLYKLLIQEIEDANEPEKFVDSSVLLFLRFFLREMQQDRFHREGKVSAPPIQESATSSVDEARQYIRNHLNQPLTAAHVARQVQMSRNNFLRHFAKEAGQTFHEYVTEQRMEAAGRFLTDGDWSISFIGRFIGLRPTQFRAQFKKHFGMTPSEFRRKKVLNR